MQLRRVGAESGMVFYLEVSLPLEGTGPQNQLQKFGADLPITSENISSGFLRHRLARMDPPSDGCIKFQIASMTATAVEDFGFSTTLTDTREFSLKPQTPDFPVAKSVPFRSRLLANPTFENEDSILASQ